MSIVNSIFSRFPRTEVVIRKIYNKINKDEKIKKNKFIKKIKYKLTNATQSNTSIGSWDNYCDYIRGLGIRNGDILIVHSSMEGLKLMNVTVEEVMAFLQNLIGTDGTLVMPAYPFYKKKQIIKLEFEEKEEDVRIFKPTTPSWTGLLPNYLCALDNAKRSLFPLDTLAAIGKHSEEMFKDNLKAKTSHGEFSSWEYCNKHHAKILFLGVSPVHSLSEIHLYEDLYKYDWPIKGWYKEQKYLIKTKEEQIEFSCNQRKEFWNQYITENYCLTQLIKNGIIVYKNIENTPIAYISDLSEMTDFVKKSVSINKDLLMWKIPRKYWK